MNHGSAGIPRFAIEPEWRDAVDGFNGRPALLRSGEQRQLLRGSAAAAAQHVRKISPTTRERMIEGGLPVAVPCIEICAVGRQEASHLVQPFQLGV